MANKATQTVAFFDLALIYRLVDNCVSDDMRLMLEEEISDILRNRADLFEHAENLADNANFFLLESTSGAGDLF